MPKMPAKIPNGIPITPTSIASKITILRICFFVAPIEESRPNCFVLSDTEMENAL